MNDYCPDCGTRFAESRDLRQFWIRLLKCPVCMLGEFLEVADMRWIFPLQRLELGSFQRLMDADADLVRLAVERIRRIDFKTVSIVDFERALAARCSRFVPRFTCIAAPSIRVVAPTLFLFTRHPSLRRPTRRSSEQSLAVGFCLHSTSVLASLCR